MSDETGGPRRAAGGERAYRATVRARRPLRALPGGCLPALAAAALVALAALAALAGCEAGSGEGLDAGGRPVGEGGEVPLGATLESIQVHVFDAACTVCHAGAAAPLGLRLDAANSYTHLVGVASRQDSSLARVEPGDPVASYLIHKLEGTASEGGRMPLGGPPIPAETIAFVRQWIADGAAPAGTPPPGAPPVVVSLDPAPGTAAPALPQEFVVGFDRELDASTVNAMTFTLARSANGTFDDGDDIAVDPASVALAAANARVAIVDLTGVASVADEWRLTVHGSGPNVVLSLDGAALDGEFGGSFPSGDGTAGGDFVATFTVGDIAPTLDALQASLFTPTCAVAGCHTGPTGPDLPSGMDLSSADASFASLVDVPSVQDPEVLRVAPGDAAASWLVMKIEGTASVGMRMPAGGPALDAETIAAVRAWIDSGAER
ncbi:MAG TPA: hypothetical protein VFY03_05620 [Woeseiaceae bacterium]|nr:hypothetical protein [Woeseiaceae bacterium]